MHPLHILEVKSLSSLVEELGEPFGIVFVHFHPKNAVFPDVFENDVSAANVKVQVVLESAVVSVRNAILPLELRIAVGAGPRDKSWLEDESLFEDWLEVAARTFDEV